MVKAAVLTGIRSMEIQEFPRPQIKDDDMLMKVDMVGVCGSDPGYYFGKMEVPFPIIMGHEIVGTVEEIGDEMSQLKGIKKGDRVVVETHFGCGQCNECLSGNYKHCVLFRCFGVFMSSSTPPYLWGAYSEYLYVPRVAVVHKIDRDVPLEAAVLTCAVIGDSIRWVRTIGGVTIGDTVVILGAGQQGLGAVVAARESGASKIIVTGTKRSSRRLELAKEFGADYIVNGDETDVVDFVNDITNGKLADVVFDASGNVKAIESATDLVRKRGTIVTPGLYSGRASIDLNKLVLAEQKLLGAFTHDLNSVIPAIKLIESRKYPLEKMVTHKYTLEEAEKAVLVAARELKDGENPIKVVIEPNK
ncbi:MAG: alcohol dehydrogenase catalytic domain-containing protein [Clostridiaceae bacterium]|nr:alcohol dehydrogenase catalytic domain-containing protein [Clostridiaceae bacterium]